MLWSWFNSASCGPPCHPLPPLSPTYPCLQAVYYAANQLPFYTKAFRQYALVDWCPVEERVSTEEFLYLSRKEILFRQLMELDICAVEAAVSMSHQLLFTQV